MEISWSRNNNRWCRFKPRTTNEGLTGICTLWMRVLLLFNDVWTFTYHVIKITRTASSIKATYFFFSPLINTRIFTLRLHVYVFLCFLLHFFCFFCFFFFVFFFLKKKKKSSQVFHTSFRCILFFPARWFKSSPRLSFNFFLSSVCISKRDSGPGHSHEIYSDTRFIRSVTRQCLVPSQTHHKIILRTGRNRFSFFFLHATSCFLSSIGIVQIFIVHLLQYSRAWFVISRNGNFEPIPFFPENFFFFFFSLDKWQSQNMRWSKVRTGTRAPVAHVMKYLCIT